MGFNVNLDREKHIATVTLDMPPMNIFTADREKELAQIFNGLNEEEGIRVVVVNSNPTCKHFCAGADLGFVWDCDTQEKLDRIDEIVVGYAKAIRECKWPVIVSAFGRVIGAGTVISACADVIVAAEGTTFACPEATIGFLGTSEHFELLVPKKMARYHFYTGTPITAEQLHTYGSVLDVVPRDQLEARTMQVAETIAAQSPLVLAYAKYIMNRNDDERLEEKYRFGNQYTLAFNTTKDFAECCKAFKEKRKANYIGK